VWGGEDEVRYGEVRQERCGFTPHLYHSLTDLYCIWFHILFIMLHRLGLLPKRRIGLFKIPIVCRFLFRIVRKFQFL